MNKSDYRMDLSFLEEFDGTITNYEPHHMLGTRSGKQFMSFVSKEADPPRFCIIGDFTSVHFLSYASMMDYIHEHNLDFWTEEDVRKHEMKSCCAFVKTSRKI